MILYTIKSPQKCGLFDVIMNCNASSVIGVDFSGLMWYNIAYIL